MIRPSIQPIHDAGRRHCLPYSPPLRLSCAAGGIDCIAAASRLAIASGLGCGSVAGLFPL